MDSEEDEESNLCRNKELCQVRRESENGSENEPPQKEQACKHPIFVPETPWKESIRGNSLLIGQMVASFSDSDAFALHFTLALIFHSNGYDISSNGGGIFCRA